MYFYIICGLYRIIVVWNVQAQGDEEPQSYGLDETTVAMDGTGFMDEFFEQVCYFLVSFCLIIFIYLRHF